VDTAVSLVRVPRPITTALGLGAPTPVGLLVGGLSQGTGSILLDATLGAGVGWLIGPPQKKAAYIVGGAVATGVAGVFGLAGLLGVRYAWDP